MQWNSQLANPMRFVLLLPLLMMACSGGTGNRAPEASSPGKAVYQSYCISCHNPNPKFDGPVGPAIFGSSRELVEARLKSATYPSGYVPKRPSQAMPPMPHVLKDLDVLVDYLNLSN